jgi:hypothetical protein
VGGEPLKNVTDAEPGTGKLLSEVSAAVNCTDSAVVSVTVKSAYPFVPVTAVFPSVL